MTITRTFLPVSIALAVTALGLGACGTSDEDEIRAAMKEFVRTEDPKRSCALMTPRAQAQLTATLGAFSKRGGGCVEVLGQAEADQDKPSQGDVDRARLRTREDRAILTFSGDAGDVGLRRLDGEWRVDDLFDPSLDEAPRRRAARLGQGSDTQQVRATLRAVVTASATDDYDGLCDLFSHGAQAQVLVGASFAAGFSDGGEDQQEEDLSCPRSMRTIARLEGSKSPFVFDALSPAQLAAVRPAIRGDRATVKVPGEDAVPFIREEGHWLLAADPSTASIETPPTAAELERCWKRAGAAIASSAGDLRFADGDRVRHIALSPGLASVKGADWRIFYTLPSSGEDPGLDRVLAKPSSVGAVAYVKDAPAHAAAVTRARECGE